VKQLITLALLAGMLTVFGLGCGGSTKPGTQVNAATNQTGGASGTTKAAG